MKRLLVCGLITLLAIAGMQIETVRADSDDNIAVSEVTTSLTKIYEEDMFDLSFDLTNDSNAKIGQVTMTIESDSFQYSDGSDEKTIYSSTIASGATVTTDELSLIWTGSSTGYIEVSLTYNYTDEGSSSTISKTEEEYIYVPTEIDSTTTVTSSTTNYATTTPTFALAQDEFPVLYKGTKNTVRIILDNITGSAAFQVQVKPSYEDIEDMGLEVLSDTFEPSRVNISSEGRKAFTMDFIVDDSVEEGNHAITYTITGTDGLGETFEQEIETYFTVIDDSSQADPIYVTVEKQDPETIYAGDDFSLDFSLKNEDYGITSAKVSFDDLPDGFLVSGESDSFSFDRVSKDSSVEFSQVFSTDADLTKGWYSFDVNYTYIDNLGYKMSRIKTVSVFIDSATDKQASISVADLKYPDQVTADVQFTVNMNVANTGKQTLTSVQVETEDNDVFIPKTSSVIQLNNLEVGDSQEISFGLVASGEDLESRNYPMTFKVTYHYVEDGEDTEATYEQSVGINVSAASSTNSKPKIIISQYNADPMNVEAGSDFTLNLTFENAHQYKTVYNVKAYLTAEEKSDETQTNIFMPVNSSNTFYVDSIGPKDTVDESITLYAMPDAQPQMYTVVVNFEYEDEDGNELTSEELIGVNVEQPTQVEMSEFTFPSSATLGDEIPLTFDVYNTGKVEVYNLKIEVDGNFTADPISKYVGNFEAGSQDYYDGYITPNESGKLEGTITVSYDEPSGDHKEITQTLESNIEEMVVNETDNSMYDQGNYDMEGMEAASSGFNKRWIGLIVGGALIVLVIIIIIIRRRRKAKKEGMIFDEDE